MMLVNYNTIFYLGHLFVLSMGSSRDGWPGYVYYDQLSGYLKLHSEPADWLTASSTCHNEDALLASPWTNQFKSCVYELQNDEDQSWPVLFSGVKQTLQAPYGYDVERLPGTYTVTLQRCGVFYSNRTTGDIDCTERLPYVCFAAENTPTAKTTVPICREISPGYELDARTEHCYKFHAQALNWTAANNTCVAEGAHLAIINSPDEAKLLSDLFEKYPRSMINGSKYSDYAAVGIYYNSTMNNWMTLDGQKIAQAGFNLWDAVEKTFDALQMPFGFMNRNGKLNNGSDSEKHPFICEKAPAPSQN